MPRSTSPVSLASFGEVLTDTDLAQVLRVTVDWPRRERARARRLGIAPNLPATVPGMTRARYRKDDVARWLQTGSSARRGRASA